MGCQSQLRTFFILGKSAKNPSPGSSVRSSTPVGEREEDEPGRLPPETGSTICSTIRLEMRFLEEGVAVELCPEENP